MRASISTRIFLGFTLVILTFCMVSIYSVYKLHRIHGNLRLIKAGYLRLILSLTEVDGDLRGYEVVLDERDPEMLVRSLRLAVVLHPFPAIIRRHLGEAIAVAAKAVRTDAIEESERLSLLVLRDSLHSMVARMDAFEAISVELSLAVEERDFERAAELQRDLKIRNRSLRREVKRITLLLRHDIDTSILRAERGETTSFWAIVALSVVAVSLSVVVTFLAQMTLEPIRSLTDAVKQVSEGGELGRVDIRGQDEVGILAAEFNRMVEALGQRDAELRRSERLAAIGRMSAQVAHEVRNPLQSIGLNTELLEEEIVELNAAGQDKEALDLIRSIQAEVERLNEVTEDYLRLARLPSPELAPESVNGVVESLLSFMSESLARASVHVVSELEPDLPPVLADENQLRQALLNLVRNALEAMDGGGSLKVRSRVNDRWVEVSIADTGGGITEDVLPHVFEPFFSTKEGGTGLGLALTQSIIESHGGRIHCRTRGDGTEFVIRLPLHTTEAPCVS